MVYGKNGCLVITYLLHAYLNILLHSLLVGWHTILKKQRVGKSFQARCNFRPNFRILHNMPGLRWQFFSLHHLHNLFEPVFLSQDKESVLPDEIELSGNYKTNHTNPILWLIRLSQSISLYRSRLQQTFEQSIRTRMPETPPTLNHETPTSCLIYVRLLSDLHYHQVLTSAD